MVGFGRLLLLLLRRFMPSHETMMIIIALLVVLAIVLIGPIAWSFTVEGLRSLWHSYTARRELITPLVPLISNFLTVLVAVVAAWIALARHFAQTTADTQRRITESFSTAVAQLGDDKLEIRLGGIFALDRISQESDQDYWPIMEILAAFAREHARWEDEDIDQQTVARLYRDEKPKELPADIAAILTVIGRRTPLEWDRKLDYLEPYQRLNLQSTNLRRANLAFAHLEGANLAGANLEGANLMSAKLPRANLDGANLRGAQLLGIDITGASLKGADLREAENLQQWQIEECSGNMDTQLPVHSVSSFGLVVPEHWDPEARLRASEADVDAMLRNFRSKPFWYWELRNRLQRWFEGW